MMKALIVLRINYKSIQCLSFETVKLRTDTAFREAIQSMYPLFD